MWSRTHVAIGFLARRLARITASRCEGETLICSLRVSAPRFFFVSVAIFRVMVRPVDVRCKAWVARRWRPSW